MSKEREEGEERKEIRFYLSPLQQVALFNF